MVDRLELCIDAAMEGGTAALNAPRGKARTKESPVGSRHSIVTKADKASNKAILNVLKKDPDSYFITEEEPTISRLKPRVLNGENFEKITEKGAYIIDEVCGTSSLFAGHYEWAVSVGYVDKNLEHVAGAIDSPRLLEKEGMKVNFSFSGQGQEMKRAMKKWKGRYEKVSKRELKESYVIFGCDCVLKDKYPKHSKLMGEVADKVMTTNMSGSCALALSLVSTGIADALVQPLQSPWDWAAGKALVNEGGGIMQFYEMDERGNSFPIDRLELKHYDPSKKAVAFIAGAKQTVPYLMDKLISLND